MVNQGLNAKNIEELEKYNQQTERLRQWKEDVKTLSDGAASAFTHSLENMHGSYKKFLSQLTQDFGHFAAEQGFKRIEAGAEKIFEGIFGKVFKKPKVDAQTPTTAMVSLTTSTNTLNVTNQQLIVAVNNLITAMATSGGSGSSGSSITGMIGSVLRPGGSIGVPGIGAVGQNPSGSTD